MSILINLLVMILILDKWTEKGLDDSDFFIYFFSKSTTEAGNIKFKETT